MNGTKKYCHPKSLKRLNTVGRFINFAITFTFIVHLVVFDRPSKEEQVIRHVLLYDSVSYLSPVSLPVADVAACTRDGMLIK